MENWHLPTTAMRIFSLERNVLMFLSATIGESYSCGAFCDHLQKLVLFQYQML